MTLFGLDTPWTLFVRDNEAMRQEAEKKFIDKRQPMVGRADRKLPGGVA